MDKNWMNLPRFGKEYIDGVSSFLDFAFTKGKPQGGVNCITQPKQTMCRCKS